MNKIEEREPGARTGDEPGARKAWIGRAQGVDRARTGDEPGAHGERERQASCLSTV